MLFLLKMLCKIYSVSAKDIFKGRQLDGVWLSTHNSIFLGAKKKGGKENRRENVQFMTLTQQTGMHMINNEEEGNSSINHMSYLKYQMAI